MKKKILSLLALTLLFSTSAMAYNYNYTTGTTSGTPTKCSAQVLAYNGGVDVSGNDNAYANTLCDASTNTPNSSYSQVGIHLFYNGGSSITFSDSRYHMPWFYTPKFIGAELKAPNRNATVAYSSHFYTDPTYGTWGTSLQVFF
ncbi:hypothetical protein I6N90_00415 [Paenibacillus sp. GSMTC-2017]|uniref:hypothetical protein n=1 Tax=Paenibacillus sp. GSMTC-2017 TaxID=2794350 RepID=UPI0018D77AC9|nr:hypothetical protein [Paenibacillus sp. GSMTC-2017]MBH5316270.1 hypothetical protein [Paenibacillus sp. GSMTC-2017]